MTKTLIDRIRAVFPPAQPVPPDRDPLREPVNAVLLSELIGELGFSPSNGDAKTLSNINAAWQRADATVMSFCGDAAKRAWLAQTDAIKRAILRGEAPAAEFRTLLELERVFADKAEAAKSARDEIAILAIDTSRRVLRDFIGQLEKFVAGAFEGAGEAGLKGQAEFLVQQIRAIGERNANSWGPARAPRPQEQIIVAGVTIWNIPEQRK